MLKMTLKLKCGRYRIITNGDSVDEGRSLAELLGYVVEQIELTRAGRAIPRGYRYVHDLEDWEY